MAVSETIVVTTVLAKAASYDLTDLETAKDELAIGLSASSADTWLRRAIGQVSKAVMNETNRVFAPEYLQDAFDVGRSRSRVRGQAALQLTRWPVLAVSSVVQGLTGQTRALTEDADFRVDYASGALYRLAPDTGAIIAWEGLPVSVNYSAGFGAAVHESHAVPASPGPYTVAIAQAASFSCDQTVSYGNGTLLTPVAANPAQAQYTVSSGGQYGFNAADTGQALTFAYCTRAIPADLVDAALRLVTARYKAKGRDPALVQQESAGTGVQRFWFGGAPGQTGPFPPDISAALDNYRVPVSA